MDEFKPIDEQAAKSIAAEGTKKRKLELEAGWLGKIFGSSDNTPVHIAGFVVILLVVSGIVYTFVPDEKKSLQTGEFWKTIAPIILTTLGYIFGASTKKK